MTLKKLKFGTILRYRQRPYNQRVKFMIVNLGSNIVKSLAMIRLQKYTKFMSQNKASPSNL